LWPARPARRLRLMLIESSGLQDFDLDENGWLNIVGVTAHG
jgi:hypothetical protein